MYSTFYNHQTEKHATFSWFLNWSFISSVSCPVGWGCRIHWLHFCRGVRPPMSVLDLTLNILMAKFQWCWSFGERRAAGSTLARSIGSNRTKLHTYAKLNCLNLNRIVRLNWIAWSRNFSWQLNFVLTFKLRTYAKRNCSKWNCFWH